VELYLHTPIHLHGLLLFLGGIELNRKKSAYLITNKILFFTVCGWCNKTHPIASLLITCIQIVTSFFSFTKNLKTSTLEDQTLHKSTCHTDINCFCAHSIMMQHATFVKCLKSIAPISQYHGCVY
jgi:hypothetical protein